MIRQLQRAQYGQRSERLDPGQLQLGLEEIEQSLATAPAGAREGDEPAGQQTSEPGGRPRRNRGTLPPHLPRFEIVVDVADKCCPCCGGALHIIGEDVSEMLDVVPAQYRVKVIRRPRYGCRGCEGAVVQAPAPERPLTGGIATEAVLAQVLVAKYCDHLPLYRQAQIFARSSIDLDRSTLASWVGRACWWLRPLAELLLGTILSSPKIFADDTPVPVLDPGRGRTKTGRLWAYARDDRRTIARGKGRRRRPSLMSTARTARVSIPGATWPTLPGCSKSTPTPISTSSPVSGRPGPAGLLLGACPTQVLRISSRDRLTHRGRGTAPHC